MTTRTVSVRSSESNFELRMWQYMRLSAILLIPLAFGHIMFVHILSNVHEISVGWIAACRWGFVGFRIYDAALLAFTMVHGMNGLRYVVDDYVHSPGTNRAIKWAILIVGLIVVAIGAYAIIAFNASIPAAAQVTRCTAPPF